ncbi:sugar phosphate isomerase/epimerase family protein [Gracilibacillus alcaliphilus]|uniref:sugar phosphate isomerase/epimerase family protein n=1 Tax=Gracilibacillus alcaliphilus TaxID=1401441 RepID=UPI00195AC4DD|nr:TIM barrel protein [Gracilibacillus alcaliphilus]MBM7677172.1 sugar phosphate isomerase/epimerase [Gracilibacillus alcaliphilus]
MKLGLCSVTFRDKDPKEIVTLVKQAELDAIEWGADVHVPVGELRTAKDVGELTRAEGLQVSSYGSYYRLADYGVSSDSFTDVLQTAKELGAPAIRVWAGVTGSEKASDDYRAEVAADARNIADLAAKENITVHLEFHGNTLTDTKESARKLMEEIAHPNVFTYWQPSNNVDVEERLQSIDFVKPWITNVHVFYWYSFDDRLNLADGFQEWQQYLQQIMQDGKDRYLLMEFVKFDDEDQFLKDAETLHQLRQQLTKA